MSESEDYTNSDVEAVVKTVIGKEVNGGDEFVTSKKEMRFLY